MSTCDVGCGAACGAGDAGRAWAVGAWCGVRCGRWVRGAAWAGRVHVAWRRMRGGGVLHGMRGGTM